MSAKERVQFNVRLDGRGELVEAVRQRSAELKVALGDFVAMALEYALNNGLSPHIEPPKMNAVEDILLEIAKANHRISILEERLGK